MLAQHASFDLVDKLQTHKSSISSDSSRLVKQVAGQFAPDAQVLYVPTGAGGNGHSEIESFLKNCAHQSHVIEDEQTISRTVGDLMIVEESILRLRHSDQVDWLLPGVRATNKQVVVPLVTIVNFNSAGMIKAKRVYWDQASVLRQIGVLPRSLYCRSNSSEVVLPIQDASIVSGLEGLKIDNARILKMAGDRNFPDMSEMDQVLL